MPVTTLRERIAISYNEDHIEYGFPSKENDNALFLSLKAAECSGTFSISPIASISYGWRHMFIEKPHLFGALIIHPPQQSGQNAEKT